MVDERRLGDSTMQMDLAQRVFRAIAEQRMVRPGDRLGVGVSGGADSLALLLLLEQLRGRLGIRLTILHFNHQLRGAESEADERFVAELAAERGMDFLAGREDVARAARARKWNLEDAARRLRYAFFSSAVRMARVTRIAVAHTADDQAETVLARLVRGTGPAGLAAIYPVKGHVVRPLLGVRRAELREFLEGLRQPWREDASNLDTARLRARLRHRILPVIERELQPAIVAHLGRLARMARDDEAFWEVFVAERLTALACREGGRLGIRCADLLAPLPWAGGEPRGAAQLALTRRLVRGLVTNLRGDCRQLTARHVEQVLHLAAESSSGHRTELPGLVAERSFDWIWLEPVRPVKGPEPAGAEETLGECGASKSMEPSTHEFTHVVELGRLRGATMVAVPEIKRRFRLKVIDWSGAARDTTQQGALDRDLLHSPLLFRNWRPGDSFRPQGRRHTHKLKQFLREARIAVRDRTGWPVLTSAGSVVWTRGLPVAAAFAPRRATRTGVVIVEEEM
jgi:tRNA(Ile)-lysidine synthase